MNCIYMQTHPQRGHGASTPIPGPNNTRIQNFAFVQWICNPWSTKCEQLQKFYSFSKESCRIHQSGFLSGETAETDEHQRSTCDVYILMMWSREMLGHANNICCQALKRLNPYKTLSSSVCKSLQRVLHGFDLNISRFISKPSGQCCCEVFLTQLHFKQFSSVDGKKGEKIEAMMDMQKVFDCVCVCMYGLILCPSQWIKAGPSTPFNLSMAQLWGKQGCFTDWFGNENATKTQNSWINREWLYIHGLDFSACL